MNSLQKTILTFILSFTTIALITNAITWPSTPSGEVPGGKIMNLLGKSYINTGTTSNGVVKQAESIGLEGQSPVLTVSGGNIGIGVTNPVAKLHVAGGESIAFGGGTNTYSGTPAGTSIVGKASASDYRITLQDGSGRVNHYWNAFFEGGIHKYITSNDFASRFLISGNSSGSTFAFYGAPIGTAGSGITWTQAGSITSFSSIWFSPRGDSNDFYINNSGNIGIGTNSPSVKLDVRGSTYLQSINFTDGSGIPYTNNWIGMANNIDGLSNKRLHIGGISDNIDGTGIKRRTFFANDIASFGGNVGIGTTSPNKLLHLKTSSGNAELDIQSGTKPHWGVYHDETTEQLRFWNGEDRVTFSSGGNVGIGTSTPSEKLTFANIGPFGTSGNIGYSTDYSYAVRHGYTDEGSGVHYFHIDTKNSGTWTNNRFIVRGDSGNIGIGTTSPSVKLEVAGQIKSTSGGFVFPDGTTQTTAASSSSGLGVDQTWQDYTSSRAVGVTYTNSTLKPIMVAITGAMSCTSNSAYFNVNGFAVIAFGGGTAWMAEQSATVIVPPGSTYSISSGCYSLQRWTELR